MFCWKLPPLSFTLNMEAVCPSETLVTAHMTTWRHNIANQNRYLYRPKKGKLHCSLVGLKLLRIGSNGWLLGTP